MRDIIQIKNNKTLRILISSVIMCFFVASCGLDNNPNMGMTKGKKREKNTSNKRKELKRQKRKKNTRNKKKIKNYKKTILAIFASVATIATIFVLIKQFVIKKTIPIMTDKMSFHLHNNEKCNCKEIKEKMNELTKTFYIMHSDKGFMYGGKGFYKLKFGIANSI